MEQAILQNRVNELINNPEFAVKNDPNFEKFIKLFFNKIRYDELLAQDNKYLFNLLKSYFEFAKDRKLESPKIRIFSHKINNQKNTIIEVINDDMPFIVDSLTAEINRLGYDIHRVINKVVCIERDEKGNLTKIHPDPIDNPDTNYESVLHFEISYIANKESLEHLKSRLAYILQAVRYAVNDWRKILDKLNKVKNETFILGSLKLHESDLSEYVKFLEWAEDNAFIFLGYTEYEIKNTKDKLIFKTKESENLGILKSHNPDDLLEIDKSVLDTDFEKEEVLEIVKCHNKSIVHRPVHLDVIRIKKYDKQGNIIGEYRFFGLFTSVVFYQQAHSIPIIRQKISHVVERANFASKGHDGKELVSILGAYPREELFQISEDELYDITMGIISLSGKSIAKIFVRYDKFKRFVSVLAYLPRKGFSTGILKKIQAILSFEFEGNVAAYYTQISDHPLARLHFIINLDQQICKPVDYDKIGKEISVIATLWQDKLLYKLKGILGEEKANLLYNSYGNAFSLSYMDNFTIDEAYADIKIIDNAVEKHAPIFKLTHHDLEKNIFSLKIYNFKEQIILSKIMPILENFGLKVIDEHTYKVAPNFAEYIDTIWVHHFRVELSEINHKNYEEIKELFEEAILNCWLDKIENDTLNKLIISAQVSCRDVSIIRSYAQYIRQTDFSYSSSFISQVLYQNFEVVKKFAELFYAKFSTGDQKKIAEIQKNIEHIVNKVKSISEDVVIRKFLELINATLRTNFFQLDSDNNFKDYISLKFASQNINDIPLPKPHAEIFVYSPLMEGVHLRGGSVARGGLRWSDRREDFRTEIQGLVKAQMTKNAVIVPVGSKGGFVIKKDLSQASRDEIMQEGIAAYKIFLSGLLDITDNIIAGKVKTPDQVIKYDGDDPYLVVAADKGTASFSDIANQVAEEYNFWLGDAFASGGSQGYNHKEMGITAKGAWVSVKRHFYEIGKNIDKENFTVIGIGGMVGDVFGNGMLLSNKLQLVAAFDHMHIFIDPNPDAAISYKERKRLFKLPRSSWMDYNAKLISQGGGIYSRNDKLINLHKNAKEALGLKKTSFTPSELIHEILKAPVDLLWNGGIGTYVKSTQENHIEVGDRANDNVRVNASDLRVKIIGEGGNLGLTQRGRIEYALNGGKVNTDAIDNSAGVDCSDHEVNIKIVLKAAVDKGLINLDQRNKLLEEMTADVESLVLRDNFLQTQAITIAEFQGVKILEQQALLMRSLVKQGILNKDVEFLPHRDEITRRFSEGIGLSRPELSVLLAYSKIYLYQSILNSNLPDDKYFHSELIRYFPEKLSNKFLTEIKSHPLRREVIATFITNSLVNRLGITFFYRTAEDTGLKTCDIARAYIITREIFDICDLWNQIENLFNKVKYDVQIEMFREISSLVERTTAWFIRNLEQPISNIPKIKEDFKEKINIIYNNLGSIISDAARDILQHKLKYYTQNKVPKILAHKIAAMDVMSSSCQIVQVSIGKNIAVDFIARIYFLLGVRLGLRYLRSKAQELKMDTYWEKLSIKSYIDNIFDQQMRITENLVNFYLEQKQDISSEELIDLWVAENQKQVTRFNDLILDIQSHDNPDFAMLNVAGTRVKEVGL